MLLSVKTVFTVSMPVFYTIIIFDQILISSMTKLTLLHRFVTPVCNFSLVFYLEYLQTINVTFSFHVLLHNKSYHICQNKNKHTSVLHVVPVLNIQVI